MKKTIKQQIRNNIDRLIRTENFITWTILEISPYTHNDRYASYEAKLVFEYMEKIDIEYVRYSEISTDKRMHGNAKVFYNDIAARRNKKLQQINKLIERTK
jgi:hypothetical protein